jgi:hypothetical protein
LTLSERIKIWREKKYRYEYRTLKEYYKSRKNKLPENYILIVIERLDKLKKLKEILNEQRTD